MAHPVTRPANNSECNFFCGAATLVTAHAALAITLLVIGILGMSGAIPMAPSAGEWMFGIGAAYILVMIGVVAQSCYKKAAMAK